MSGKQIDAPAKINLGLEILGVREDGFHEIRSVLATISLCDTLVFTPASGIDDEIAVEGAAGEIPAGPNLIAAALDALRNEGADIPAQSVRLIKRIPVASGLGGASTDAAATLHLFGRKLRIPEPDLVRIARTLGSDVPFFLGAPYALVKGRGEDLTALPSPTRAKWVVTVTPDLHIPAKTATMYKAISEDWWTSGAEVEAFASSFPRLTNALPPNVFARALFSQFPDAGLARDRLLESGLPFVAVSGAGPTMFALFDSAKEASDVAAKTASALPAAIVQAAQVGVTPTALNSRRE